jgi:outer membrane protein TolC
MKPSYLLLLLSLLSFAQPVPAATPLTLEEALTTAQKNHPQVIEASENVQGAEARRGQARAAYYPQISVAADWNRGKTFIAAQESSRVVEAASV